MSATIPMTYGVDLLESPFLPTRPSTPEDCVRIVRHGLADILAWLGEAPGPRPGAPTHAFWVGSKIVCSKEFADRLKREVTP